MNHNDYQMAQDENAVVAVDRAYQARVLTRLLGTPGKKPSLQDLSDETGLQPSTIQMILADPDLQKVQLDTCREMVAGVMVKFMNRVEAILDDERTSPSMVIQAGRALVQTYQALDKTADAKEATQGMLTTFAELVKTAREKNQGRIKVE